MSRLTDTPGLVRNGMNTQLEATHTPDPAVDGATFVLDEEPPLPDDEPDPAA